MYHLHHFGWHTPLALIALLIIVAGILLADRETAGRILMVAAVIMAFSLLCGCATCDRHPTACAVGAAVIAGSIIAASHRDADQASAQCSANDGRVHCHP